MTRKKSEPRPDLPSLPSPYDDNLAALRLDLDADDVPSSVRDAGRTLLDGLRDSLALLVQRVATRHPGITPPALPATVEPRLVHEHADGNDESGSWWIVLHPLESKSSRRRRALPANRLAAGLAEVALRIPESPTPETPIEIRTRFLTFEAMVHAAQTFPPMLPDLLAMPMVAEGIDKMVAMIPGQDLGIPN